MFAWWIYRQDSGAATCSNNYLGYYGSMWIQECQVFVPAQPSSAQVVVGGGPLIDVAKIPIGSPGVSVPQVEASSIGISQSDGTGAFRISCSYAQMRFDDPLVKPGQPGQSHLHIFFGNTGVTADSTAASIASTGNSTCAGGTLNRTAYWVPAMIDTLDGTPLAPPSMAVYYKTGYFGVVPSTVKSIPQGLRMVAGDPKATGPGGPVTFGCADGGENLGNSNTVQNCPVGATMLMGITFPQCWDGVNLDSPDHKSHMAYPIAGRGCPTTHPVALPEISYHLGFLVKEANAPLRWRLSSDNYPTTSPGGYSAHADYVYGWDPATVDAWVRNCDNPALDCHSNLLGDGRMLY